MKLGDIIKLTSSAEKIKPIFDYKILILILGIAIAYHVLNSILDPISPEFNLIDVFELANMVIVTTFAFSVAKRYKGSEVFGKTYLALAISCVTWLVAEIIWQIYDNVLFVYPYPSVADIFYFAFYPFAIYHLTRNIRYFKRKFDVKSKIWLIAVPVFVTIVYSYFTIADDGEFSFDYYYGMIFVIPSAISLALAVIGGFVFRQSILATVWSLLAAGIVIRSFADVWYYYLEIFGQYNNTHVTNTMWFAGWLIITYALFLHRKAI